MKIAFVLINANRREGTSRAVVEVAERLANRHEVTVFARTNETLDQSKVKWCKVAAPAWPDVAEFECFRLGAEYSLRKNHFDIVHSAGCNVWNADVYAIQTVHPKKMEVNQQLSRDKHVGLFRRFSRRLYDRRVVHSEKQAYRSSNRRGIVGYLPVSSGTEHELRSTYAVEQAQIEVVPNGADLERFTPSSRELYREAVRRELNCDERAVVFLFAGGEWRRKGLNLAIEALAKASHSDRLLVVAGDDPQRHQYVSLAEQQGVAERVRWVGFRKDIERLYAAADVFLFPSAYEAFSLATIEAAAAGLPVVMCDICGAQELLGDGSSGFIVERDAQAISRVMDRLADNLALRNEMGLMGREKVERLFHWDRIADQTEAFYDRLLRARGGSH